MGKKVNLGTLSAQISANTTALAKAQREVHQLSQKMEQSLGGASKKAHGLSKDFSDLQKFSSSLMGKIAMLAGAGGFGLLAVNIGVTGAKFEQTMATVKGVSRATEIQFVKMKEKAREMGRETEWSATQAAEGMQFLSMAGFNAEQTVAALPGVLDLATAGQIDLGRAADVASNALTAMRLPVEELGRVNDTFIQTITSSNTNMEMMAESFKYAAPLAAAMGYSVEEASAYIGMLGNAGIQGSMAGTQLGMAFQQAHLVFERYGVSANNADGSTKNLADALQLLEEKGASALDVMDIFSERGGRAVLALMGQGSEAVRRYIDHIEDAEGASKKLADTMRNTTIGAWKELQSAIESVKIDAFESNAGAIKQILQDMAGFVRENADSIVWLSDTLGTFVQYGVAAWHAFNRAASASVGAVMGMIGKLIGYWRNALAWMAGSIESASKAIAEIRQRTAQNLATMHGADAGLEDSGPIGDGPHSGVLDSIAASLRKQAEGVNSYAEGFEAVESFYGEYAAGALDAMGEQLDKIDQGVADRSFADSMRKHVAAIQRQNIVDPWMQFSGQGGLGIPNALNVPDLPTGGGGGGGGSGKGKSEAEQALKEQQRILEQFNKEYTASVQGRYAEERRALNKQLAEYSKHVQDKDKLNKWHAAELKKITEAETQYQKDELEKRLTASKEWVDHALLAVMQYEESIGNSAANVGNGFKDVFNGIEDWLVGMATGAEDAFSNMADSILADLARIMIQQTIMEPLAQGISGLLSGGGGGIGAFFAGLFHGGGVVGSTGTTRAVNPGVFAGAPRLHDGLAADEFPAILQRGETVIPRGRSASSPTVNVYVINQSNSDVQVQETENAGGGTDIKVMIAQAVAGDIRGGGAVYGSIRDTFNIKPQLRGR